MKNLVILAICGLVALAAPGVVAKQKQLGVFGDWEAHMEGEKRQRTCWILSRPKKDEGNYTRRGPIYAVVGHILADKMFHQVQFEAGYTFRTHSVVTVKVGKQEFELYTYKDSAWAHNEAKDRKLTAAMRAWNEMIVVGTSSRGTKTTDTYSLKGFTAAHNAINKACGVKALN